MNKRTKSKKMAKRAGRKSALRYGVALRTSMGVTGRFHRKGAGA